MKKNKTGIVIVSGSCCIPGMAALDKKAREIVDKAVSETGIAAQIEVVPVTAALGLLPKGTMLKLMGDFNSSGRVGLPAVLINGKAVSLGVPKIEEIKSALEGVKK